MLLEKQLSLPRLSPTEIADILERHLGDGTDAARCTEACSVLRQLRKDAANVYLRFALRPLDNEADACVAVRKVLATLRSWRHLSGA